MANPHDGSNGSSGFMGGFILGGLVGAALALILSPRPGRDYRETLAEKGAELRQKAEEVLPKAADEVQQRARSIIDAQRGRVEEAVEDAREAAEQARDQLAKRFEAAKGEPPG